jgi:hypothetical protein
MTKPQNQKLTRVAKVSLDLLFWLLVIAAAFLILWIALSLIIMNLTDIPFTASVPIAIGSGGESQFQVEVVGSTAKGIQAAYIDDAQGILRLETTNWSFIIISNLAKLFTALGLACIIYYLRSVITAVLNGEPFNSQNAVNIRRIGYLVLLVGFLRPAVETLAAQAILKQLTLTTPDLSLPSIFQAEVLLASLLILVLAQVWSYGVDLERDRMLTI